MTLRTKLTILLLLLILISLGYWRSLTTPSSLAAPEDFTRPELCLGQAIVQYHQTLNDLFNSKIDLLTSGKPEAFVDKLPELDLKTGQRRECESNNVTTFCLARQAVNHYQSFLQVMSFQQERISDAGAAASGSSTLDQELVALISRSELITKEVTNAKNSLDLALATYHEFRLAYPLHKKFEQTYGALEKFRDKMGEMRRLVNLYRYKFVDVTTTSCQ